MRAHRLLQLISIIISSGGPVLEFRRGLLDKRGSVPALKAETAQNLPSAFQ